MQIMVFDKIFNLPQMTMVGDGAVWLVKNGWVDGGSDSSLSQDEVSGVVESIWSDAGSSACLYEGGKCILFSPPVLGTKEERPRKFIFMKIIQWFEN